MNGKYYYVKIVKCGCGKRYKYIFETKKNALSFFKVLSEKLVNSYELYLYSILEGEKEFMKGIKINRKERKTIYDNN